MTAQDSQHVQQLDNNLQILTFVLDKEWFGTEIQHIQEVLEYRRVTPVPRTPSYMLGVINLRGKVVPVIDLRDYFGLTITTPTVNSCIIIVDIMIEGEEAFIGLLADSVQEVLELTADQIQSPPSLGARIKTKFIKGIIKQNEDMIILLHLANVFSGDDLAELKEISNTQTHN
jgi:purine-binding chemotaxis protein CheW